MAAVLKQPGFDPYSRYFKSIRLDFEPARDFEDPGEPLVSFDGEFTAGSPLVLPMSEEQSLKVLNKSNGIANRDHLPSLHFICTVNVPSGTMNEKHVLVLISLFVGTSKGIAPGGRFGNSHSLSLAKL